MRKLLEAPDDEEPVSAAGRKRILEGIEAIDRGDVGADKRLRSASNR